MAISMLKIRRPLGRLIFNMGIAIPGKTVFLIEMAPSCLPYVKLYSHLDIQNFGCNISWELKMGYLIRFCKGPMVLHWIENVMLKSILDKKNF